MKQFASKESEFNLKKMSMPIEKFSLKKQNENANDDQVNAIKTASVSSPQTQGRQCIIILTIFLSVILLMVAFLGYSIYVNLSKANEKLEKMQLKFHKFLFYLKYIYKTERQKEEIDAEQTSSIMDLFTKLTKNDQEKTDLYRKVEKGSIKKISSKNRENLSQILQNKHQNSSKQFQDEQLFSHEQMVDIAKKIIEQEQESSKEENQHQKSKVQENQKRQVRKNSISNIMNLPNSQPDPEKVNNFNCQTDDENAFYPNFVYDPQTQRLRKTIFTSRFQTIICEQPIPKQGIWQLSIKIIQTAKSFIYLGIAGGLQPEIYNLTSLHENKNFYGYSGFSGRIWQATKRKNAFEMIQKNTMIKLMIDMNIQKIEYFFNGLKVGESWFGNLCEKQCKFVVEMYNDGDEVQILRPKEFNELNKTIQLKDMIQSQL